MCLYSWITYNIKKIHLRIERQKDILSGLQGNTVWLLTFPSLSQQIVLFKTPRVGKQAFSQNPFACISQAVTYCRILCLCIQTHPVNKKVFQQPKSEKTIKALHDEQGGVEKWRRQPWAKKALYLRMMLMPRSQRCIRVNSCQIDKVKFQNQKATSTSSPLLPISESKCGH